MPPRKTDTPYREIPLELIDEPPLPMRQSFDQAALDQLTESIRDMGVLLPIVVEQKAGRYQIHDGHRRYIGASHVGLKTIPAVVRDTSQVSGEAVKIHANIFREDVNPAEEAHYLNTLLQEQCGADVDRLCKLTHQLRSYVEGRLILLQGDPDVFEALRQRRLSIAVAKELNRVKDRGYRMMYLDAAIKGGATARLVQEWRIAAENLQPTEPPPPNPGGDIYAGRGGPITTFQCVCCQSGDEPWDMELLYMHRRCRQIFFDRWLAGARPGGLAHQGIVAPAADRPPGLSPAPRQGQQTGGDGGGPA